MGMAIGISKQNELIPQRTIQRIETTPATRANQPINKTLPSHEPLGNEVASIDHSAKQIPQPIRRLECGIGDRCIPDIRLTIVPRNGNRLHHPDILEMTGMPLGTDEILSESLIDII